MLLFVLAQSIIEQICFAMIHVQLMVKENFLK